MWAAGHIALALSLEADCILYRGDNVTAFCIQLREENRNVLGAGLRLKPCVQVTYIVVN